MALAWNDGVWWFLPNHAVRQPVAAIRSSTGAGMTPVKVAGTPEPESSVMISKTFGVPLLAR